MEHKPYIVPGEAPESDSEEEVNITAAKGLKMKHSGPNNPQGIIVAGEAPESDEEHEEDAGSVSSVSSAASVLSLASLTSGIKRNIKVPAKKKKPDGAIYSTLLHKRLRERNMSLHKNVHDIVQDTVVTAGRELNTVNHQLLRSQCQLQEAETAVRVLQTHLMQLQMKLAAVTSTAFLPYINTPAANANGVEFK